MSSPRKSSRSRNTKSALELLGATPRGQKRKLTDDTTKKIKEEKTKVSTFKIKEEVTNKKTRSSTEPTDKTPRRITRRETPVNSAERSSPRRSRSATNSRVTEEKSLVDERGDGESCVSLSTPGRTRAASKEGQAAQVTNTTSRSKRSVAPGRSLLIRKIAGGDDGKKTPGNEKIPGNGGKKTPGNDDKKTPGNHDKKTSINDVEKSSCSGGMERDGKKITRLESSLLKKATDTQPKKVETAVASPRRSTRSAKLELKLEDEEVDNEENVNPSESPESTVEETLELRLEDVEEDDVESETHNESEEDGCKMPVMTLDEATGQLMVDGQVIQLNEGGTEPTILAATGETTQAVQSQEVTAEEHVNLPDRKMVSLLVKQEMKQGEGVVEGEQVLVVDQATGDETLIEVDPTAVEESEMLEMSAEDDKSMAPEGTSQIIKVIHGKDGAEGDGTSFTEIVIVKMDSNKDREPSFIKTEPGTPERRKSTRMTKPTPKQAALDELKDTLAPVKVKDIMRENVVVIGGKDGRSTMKCKHCDFKVNGPEDFQEHIKTHPDVVLRIWQCPVCYYRVSSKDTLKTHMQTHTAAKEFKCTECGKLFSTKQRLAVHMKYHNDVRDQECPLCDKAFHEYKTLQNHLCMIHKTSKVEAIKFLTSQHPGNPINRSPDTGPAAAAASTSETATDQGQVTVVTADHISQSPSVPKVSSALEAVNREFTDEPTIAIQVSDATHAELEDALRQANIPGKPDEKDDRTTLYDLNTGTVVTEEVVEAPTVIVDHTTESEVVESEATRVQQDNGVGVLQEEIVIPESSRSSLFGTVKTQAQTKLYRELTSGDNIRKIQLPTVGESSSEDQVQKIQFPVFKIKNDGVLRLKPDGGIAIGKKGRWINNQRYTKIEDISPDILEYADVEEGDVGVKIIFRCKLCDRSLPSKSQFQSHMEQHHPEIKPWKCNQCDYQTRMRTSLIIHKKIHNGEKKYQCTYCPKKFLFKQKLTNHMKHHENKREHKCPICERGFNEKSDMSKHLKRVHMNIRPHECQLCKKSYKEPVQLRNHLETHSGIKQNECNVCHKFYLTRKSLLQHMKCHTCMFHCEICNKSFGSYSGFMAHKVMHDESYGGYRCDICMKILHTKGSLHRHKNVAHNDDRPYQCRSCSKAFKTKKDLKNHLVVHSEDKEYQCTLCSYQAKRPENLKVHMRRHNEIKPYQCGICGRDYTQRMALERHLVHHTTPTVFSNKKIQCHICQMCFFNQKTYEQHMEQEHHVMAKQKELIEEVVVTSGEQTEKDTSISMTVFLCEECNSVFTTQDELAGHILGEHMKQPIIKPGSDSPGNDGIGSEIEIATKVPSIQKVIITDEYGIKVSNASKQDVGTVVSIPENDMMNLSQDQLVSLISQDETSASSDVIMENQVVEVENVINDGQIPSHSVLNINHVNSNEGHIQLSGNTDVENVCNQNLETLLAVAEQMQLPVAGKTEVEGDTRRLMVEEGTLSISKEPESVVTTEMYEADIQTEIVEIQTNTSEGGEVTMEDREEIHHISVTTESSQNNTTNEGQNSMEGEINPKQEPMELTQ